MRKAILFAILIILPVTVICAIYAPGSFRHIGVRNGLSNSFAVDMAIDNQGFVWVATEDGLNRCAGGRVRTFTTANSRIAGDEPVCLYFRRKSNELWIGMRQAGVSVYNCHTGTFRNYAVKDGLLSPDIADISEAADGGIWILHRNRGIQHLDVKTGRFRDYPRNRYPLLGHAPRVVADDGRQHLYIGQFGRGLSVIDLKIGRLTNFNTHNSFAGGRASGGLPSDYVRDVFIDSKKRVWIGTNNGVALFNLASRTFTQIAAPLAGENIHDITELKDGSIAVSADLGGITILDSGKAQGVTVPDGRGSGWRSTLITTANSRLSSSNIRKVLNDRFGNLWIGNYSTGVDFMQATLPDCGMVDFRQSNNQPYKIYSVYRDNDDNLWFGGENMLALYSHGKVSRTWNLSPSIGHAQTIVYAVSSDREGNIWLGLNGWGVLRFDKRSGSFTTILRQNCDVHAFCPTPEGKMWIGAGNRLYTYSRGGLQEEKVLNKALNCPIYALLQDASERLWVGTLGKGIFVFDKDGRRIARLNKSSGLPSDNINQIYMDRRHRIWIATYNGLARIDDTGRIRDIKVFHLSSDAKNDNVRAVIEDLHGNIWASTFSGLSCLRRNKQGFVNYDFTDGLPEGGFVENGIAMQADGTIYVVSPYGIGYVNSVAAEDNRRPPALQLTDIACFNSRNVGLPLFLNDGLVRVPSDKNSVTFSFTVENFARASTVEYACMMEGVDKDWRYLGTATSASYKDLAPGKYQFKLRVKNKNGDWSNGRTLSISVVVAPPLWLTWYAKIFYLCLFVAAVWTLRAMARRRRRSTRNTAEGGKKETVADETISGETLTEETLPEEALPGADEKFMHRLDALIEANMKTGKLDIAFLSDNMNMSHSTFYRKLKALTGLTPVDYVKKYKLKKSIELLKSKELSITEIAYLTGFNSAAHYREAFKDVYGTTPSQYLKQLYPGR